LDAKVAALIPISSKKVEVNNEFKIMSREIARGKKMREKNCMWTEEKKSHQI
jgi:hypothetical protein